MHLRAEHDLSADEIAEIVCTVPPGQVKRNFEPEQVKYSPPSGYAAISSIPYMVAAALVEGRLTLKEVTDEKVRDPQILALASKIKKAVDPAYRDYQNAAVEIRLRDGRTYRREQTDAVGSPELPAPRELVERKFRENAEHCMEAKNVDRIIEAVSGLEKSPDINGLTTLLRKTTGP